MVVSKPSHPVSWPTESELHMLHIIGASWHPALNQQKVSDIGPFSECGFINSCDTYDQQEVSSIANLLNAASSCPVIWSWTGSEQHYTSFWMQPHHFLWYDQQEVSNIAHHSECLFHNVLSYVQQRVSATVHFCWMAVTWHLSQDPQTVSLSHFTSSWNPVLWQTGCEWHCTFC